MSVNKTRVYEIISEHLGVEIEKITDESKFAKDLGADSLDMVELTMAFEEHLGIEEIPDAEMYQIETVADALAVIEKKLK